MSLELTEDTAQDPRWAALMSRDPRPPASFVFAVKSTGVYCRSSCPARRPKAENVVFFATAAEAEQAGFRACKRCRPDKSPVCKALADKIAEACRMLERIDGKAPSFEQLAARVGLSPYHFHRVFKSATGVTPKQYADARRAARVRDRLQSSSTVTDAIYDAGYNSSGRFYSEADQTLGMLPAAFQQGGQNTAIRFAVSNCSLGKILVAQSERGICMIALGDDATVLVHDLKARFPRAEFLPGNDAFAELVSIVIGFIENPKTGLDLPLDIRGTAFQQRVWLALREIPPGATVTYSDVAARLGRPTAVRAVANACAKNSLAVAVPCHRVVRNDGSLSGYRWGAERKRTLLERESEANRFQNAESDAQYR